MGDLGEVLDELKGRGGIAALTLFVEAAQRFQQQKPDRFVSWARRPAPRGMDAKPEEPPDAFGRPAGAAPKDPPAGATQENAAQEDLQ